MRRCRGLAGCRAAARAIAGAGVVLACLGPSPARAQLNCNAGVEYHPNGGIERCNLNGEHRLQTTAGISVQCANGKLLEKYPDGRLRSCVIPRATSFGDLRCERDSRVDFDHDGTVRGCESPHG